EVIGQIADPKVKSYYAQDLRGRVSRLFGPKQDGGFRRSGGFGERPWSAGGFRAGRAGARFFRDPRTMPVTPELRRSALARDASAVVRRIEQLLVLTMLNHPDLLDDHCEEFSRIEIKAGALDRLRNEIIDIA